MTRDKQLLLMIIVQLIIGSFFLVAQSLANEIKYIEIGRLSIAKMEPRET